MKSESNKNQPEIYFPDEIIAQILLFLPFGSVLTCKRLSKQWRDFINHKNFARNYLHKRSMILLLEGIDLYCVLPRHNNKVTYTVHRIPISLNQPNHEHRIPISLNQPNHELLSGWSDGIACVKESNGRFILYNLFTGALHTVEDATIRDSKYWICYGFGYDRIDDDYKIMVACDYNKAKFVTEKNLFWVYSFRNRCWRLYDGFPYVKPSYIRPQFSPCGGYCSNGILHFSVKRGGKPVIVTYDLHTRKFGEILAPLEHFGYGWAKVFDLEGRLCYGYDYYNIVVEARDAGGSWTKLFVMNSSVMLNFADTTLYECGDGRRVVLVCGGRLMWYDFRKNEIEEVDVTSMWQIKRMQLRLMKRIEKILGMMQVQQNVEMERGHWQQMMRIQQYLMKEREHMQETMQMQKRQLKPREHRQRMEQIRQNLKKKRGLMQEIECGKFNKASVWII